MLDFCTFCNYSYSACFSFALHLNFEETYRFKQKHSLLTHFCVFNICEYMFIHIPNFCFVFLYFTLLTDWALYNTASAIHPTLTPPWLHEHRQVQLPVEDCCLLTRWHLECWFHKRGNFSLKCHKMKWQKGRTLSIYLCKLLSKDT